jgi:AraC-like DNA-binding protein
LDTSINISSHKPSNQLLTGFIESYFFIEARELKEVQTIPNGRIDASIVLEGEIEWFYPEKKIFTVLPSCSFYPLTGTIGRARAENILKCVSIKFYPHLLAHFAFQNHKLKEPAAFHVFFKTPEADNNLVAAIKEAKTPEQKIKFLDSYFADVLLSRNDQLDKWIMNVIQGLGKNGFTERKIGDMAKDMKISVKTLERRFIKIIGITPQMFSKIIQLQKTIHKIKKGKQTLLHGDLLEALDGGYFDQSHFIKSCKSITGFTPKKLFAQQPSQMTDLIVLKNN